jgi:hypothetical protein
MPDSTLKLRGQTCEECGARNVIVCECGTASRAMLCIACLEKALAECKAKGGYEELSWSDRRTECGEDGFVYAVICCSLDHSYDRTPTGVPWGMPKKYAEAFAPIVAKHLSAIHPKWQDHTVYMSGEQREVFQAELTEAFNEARAQTE